MNNEIASVRVQLLLRNARDLSVERFSRRGVRLNAIGLIAYRGCGRFAYFADAIVIVCLKLTPRFGVHASFS